MSSQEVGGIGSSTKCLGYYPVLIHREEERHALSDCRNAMGNSNCRETEVTMALDVLLYFFLLVL